MKTTKFITVALLILSACAARFVERRPVVIERRPVVIERRPIVVERGERRHEVVVKEKHHHGFDDDRR